jgi:hypothetical protein
LAEIKMSEDLTNYKEYFASWVTAPCSISVTFISRFINGEWLAQCSRIEFGPKQWEKEESWQISSTYLRVGTLKLNISSTQDAETIFESVVDGRLEIANLAFSLPQIDKGLNFYASQMGSEPTLFIHSLKVTPKDTQLEYSSRFELLAIDEALRCGTPTFDGSKDLFAFLGFPEDAFNQIPFLELVVSPPVDVDLENCSLIDGKLKVSLIKHSNLDAKNISIGVKLFPHPFIDRRMQLPSTSVQWRETASHQLGEITLTVVDTVIAQILLSLDGKTVRRHHVTDISRSVNARFQAYKALESDKKLQDALNTPRSSKEFEKAITTIFHLLGFSAANFFETEAPDVILSSPKGRVLLVECTMQTHDIRTKAGKLHHRRQVVQDKLKAEFPWIPVIAILVCNLERDKITEDDFLQTNNIILYCKEDIQSALAYLPVPYDPDLVIDEELAKFTNSKKHKLWESLSSG